MARVLAEKEKRAYSMLLIMYAGNEEEQWRIREEIEFNKATPSELLETEQKKLLEKRKKMLEELKQKLR